MRTIKYILPTIIGLLFLASCEKDINIDLPEAPTDFVVEGYINQYNPLFNYVILSRTLDYFNPRLQLPGVKGALVYVTEGTANGKDTTWDTINKIQLVEIGGDSIPGIYFNPLLSGKEGKVYKLEITVDGKYIHGITTIPKRVPLDSLTYSVELNPNDNKDTGKFITIHFMEPVEKGNNYRAMFRLGADSAYFGWGSISAGDAVFNDDIINGVYRSFKYGRNFEFGDTIHYYFNSIDRVAFNFWDSYNSAANNGGPFATPVSVKSNVQGAIGSFTGMAVTYKKIIIERP